MKNSTLVIICVDNIDRARLRERKHANIAIVSILLFLIIPGAIKRKDCEEFAHEEYAKIPFGDILIS